MWGFEFEPSLVVVFYYDKDAAVAEGVIENDLLEALDEAGGHSTLIISNGSRSARCALGFSPRAERSKKKGRRSGLGGETRRGKNTGKKKRGAIKKEGAVVACRSMAWAALRGGERRSGGK